MQGASLGLALASQGNTGVYEARIRGSETSAWWRNEAGPIKRGCKEQMLWTIRADLAACGFLAIPITAHAERLCCGETPFKLAGQQSSSAGAQPLLASKTVHFSPSLRESVRRLATGLFGLSWGLHHT